ncbi:Alpha/beta hydrolase family-domain-containing protein [Crucibulum laeve]|uniref:Alpha/beta hydrolase family-domain-containing protein n=1 Tax=Crucibulum laeve TaxID=68775 RepID=A0A5C3MQ44_9AGAR|nr:Alpha/beta hydrolase family-domain-containing protein [Crucibulum laeve]
MTLRTAGLLAAACFTALFVLQAVAGPDAQQGTLHRRSYFYVGQTYFAQGNSSIAAKQLYVEHLSPAKTTKPYPLLFIHGNGMTGTNFLNTPDGRLGWADYFLSKGYEIYIVDQQSRGRSAWQKDVDGAQAVFDTNIIESRFTATKRYKIWPQADLHTQWPGNGSVGDPSFDLFYASIMPYLSSTVETSENIKLAGTQLLDIIGPVILLTHSQSGQFGWILGDSRPSLVKAIVAIEPIGPPFINAIFPPITPARPYGLTEIPLSFAPPIGSANDLQPTAISTSPSFTCYRQTAPARQLVNLSRIPVLLVTSESGYHAIYDTCSTEFLQQAGVSVEHVNLADVGIRGNGHMMFMELNSLTIAEQVVDRWISKISH